MEFNERLQQLRKQNGLTQEELAAALYVSRTAVSKWESGRGYPNIDSLKAISRFFSVTVDELISSGEVVLIAEDDKKKSSRKQKRLMFGALDLSFCTLLFLPLFGYEAGGKIYVASLFALPDIKLYLAFAYLAAVSVTMAWGVFTLAMLKLESGLSERVELGISFLLNVAGLVLFIISRQTYPAIVLLIFLVIKVMAIVKSK